VVNWPVVSWPEVNWPVARLENIIVLEPFEWIGTVSAIAGGTPPHDAIGTIPIVPGWMIAIPSSVNFDRLDYGPPL
jgi:hypothetical protein